MKNNEIKCPHCGSAFTVNESEYATLLEQIKAKEIEKAVDEKVKLINEKAAKDSEIAVLNAVSEKTKEIAEKLQKTENSKYFWTMPRKKQKTSLLLPWQRRKKALQK